jgi:hypothetical protein
MMTEMEKKSNSENFGLTSGATSFPQPDVYRRYTFNVTITLSEASVTRSVPLEERSGVGATCLRQGVSGRLGNRTTCPKQGSRGGLKTLIGEKTGPLVRSEKTRPVFSPIRVFRRPYRETGTGPLVPFKTPPGPGWVLEFLSKGHHDLLRGGGDRVGVRDL